MNASSQWPDVVVTPDGSFSVGGHTVAATRYSPVDATEPLPVVLMSIPYHKDDFITYGSHDPHLNYLATHGYHVVVADMVGTGASTGTKSDLLEADAEADELVELIGELVDPDWSNGRIGMFGKSYGGLTCLEAASRNPAPLEAIIPAFGPFTGWKDQTRSGSVAMYNNLGHWGPLMHTLEAKPPSRRDRDGHWATIWHDRLDRLDDEWTPYLFRLLEHESKDAYWAGKDVPVDRIEVPTFAVGGFRDVCEYAQTAIDYFEQIDAPKRLLLGPWRHTMPYRGRESAIDFRRQTRLWFDRYLKDQETGVDDWPAVTYWTERHGGGRVDDGHWRGGESWPSLDDDTERVSFALAPTGLVESSDFTAGTVAREYEIDHTVGVSSMDRGVMGGTPVPSNDDDARSMCFDSDPLDRAIELTGTGSVTIRIRSSTADPIVYVRLVDVDENGTGRNVAQAKVRANYRDGRTSPEGLELGEAYTLELPLSPTSHVFEAGHRLRVAVSGAYFPVMLPSIEHGSLTVLSTPAEPSTVEFPGRTHGERVTFEDERSIAPPDETVPVESPAVVSSDSSWSVERDHLANTVLVDGDQSATLDPPHADVSWSQDIRAQVVADDPSSAVIRQDSAFVLEYPTSTVRIEGATNASRTYAWATLAVHEDGVETWSNQWRWTRDQ